MTIAAAIAAPRRSISSRIECGDGQPSNLGMKLFNRGVRGDALNGIATLAWDVLSAKLDEAGIELTRPLHVGFREDPSNNRRVEIFALIHANEVLFGKDRATVRAYAPFFFLDVRDQPEETEVIDDLVQAALTKIYQNLEPAEKMHQDRIDVLRQVGMMIGPKT